MRLSEGADIQRPFVQNSIDTNFAWLEELMCRVKYQNVVCVNKIYRLRIPKEQSQRNKD